MKKTGYLIFLATLVIAVLFSSCNVARGEADVSAYLTESYLIAGVNGKNFSTFMNPGGGDTAGGYYHKFTIQLVGGEFQNITNGNDVSEWIYPIENRVPGVTWTVDSFTRNSLTIKVDGKPVLNNEDRYENAISVKIPAVFVKNRIEGVEVFGENKLNIKIFATNDRVAFANPWSVTFYSYYNNRGLGGGPIITLNGEGTAFKKFDKGVISSTYFSKDNPELCQMNVTYSTNSPYSETCQYFYVNYNSGMYNEDGKEKFTPPINKSSYFYFTLPSELLTDGEEKGDLEVISYAKYKMVASVNAYIANDVKISGKTSTSESDTIEEKDIIINLSLTTFKKPTSSDVTSWFTNAPNGLKFTLKNFDTINGINQAIVTVSGAPTTTSDAPVEIKLPKEVISNTNAGSVCVDPRNAYYDIKQGDFYSWNMYDFASFTNATGIGGSSNSESINKNMTKAYDGSDIVFESDNNNRIAYGATREVKFDKGLSRHGYRLKGFYAMTPLLDSESEARRIKNINGRVSYEMDETIDYPCTGDNISFTLKDEHKGQNISLFAIWEPDGTYFKEAFDITVTKEMIDAANPTDKAKSQLSNLAHHDGTALENDYKQVFSFISLPAGKIGGTTEAPEYLKWMTYWNGGSATPISVAIKNDFAISDISLTASLWNVVYAWATSEDRLQDIGEKYNFAEDPSSNGYPRAGAKYTTTSNGVEYTSRHSAEDPLVYINWYTSLIFANALTEWYNATQNPTTPLTIAYTEDGTSSGKVLRDATQTSILDQITSGENIASQYKSGLTHVDGSTGFRMPTFAELSYASTVMPTLPSSDMIEAGIGVSYPFAQSYNAASGYRRYNVDEDVRKAYVVYMDLYNNTSDYGTQAVGKYFKVDSVRTNGAKPNAVGLYDMTGNICQWSADWNYVVSNASRYIFGGAWYLPIGYINSQGNQRKPNGSLTDGGWGCGIRYCRSL